MDKTKLAAVGFLALLVGTMVWSSQQNPPAPAAVVEHDHDGDGKPDHGPEAHEEPASTGANTPTANASAGAGLAGGVTALKVQDLRVGKGKTARSGDQLTMNYKGQLLNGQVFDQSYGREPFTFRLGAGQVIKGWDQGIMGMKEGGKRKLTIPASLGYGDTGAGGSIPGGATLIFEVELIKVGA